MDSKNEETTPPHQTSQQPNIIRNKKTHVKYFSSIDQERLPSISEWFPQSSSQRSISDSFVQTTFPSQQISDGSVLNNNFHIPNSNSNNNIIRNRSISDGSNNVHVSFSTTFTQTPNNDQSMLQQNVATKLIPQNGRGKAPHSRVRSVPPVTVGENWNNQISTDTVTSSSKLPLTSGVPTKCNNGNKTGFNSCNLIVNQSSHISIHNNNNVNSTNIFQTVDSNSFQKSNPSTSLLSTGQSSTIPNNTTEPKNEFVLVIENEESIKQYSERASLHNPNPFNPLSRRISAKEVWNSIAAATQANKMVNNSPKIKKQNKMSRNRCLSPTVSNNTSNNLIQSTNQSVALTPLSSITIRSRKRSNSSPLVLPFDKLTLEDSPTLNQKQVTIFENNESANPLHLLGNEFVDFSNGEHESQRKNRGEKVFKFKMINF